ncbi:MAG: ABC transporter ATP-binding protein [Acidimicrobiia bacterium]|nr:ABC transporter ATP-binding protein [Acidimicrobiia bacterium]
MLTVNGLSKNYRKTVALDDVSFELPTGTTMAVLGPSGSGKSTLLRVIAGLEEPDRGRVMWEHADLAGVAAHERRFGLMFQDYALFPHRDVAGNVGFGLRMAGWSTGDIGNRVREVLEIVGLAGFEGRSITELSGGEAQRVALARTVAPAPRLVMLDEPLGSLDRSLREQLVVELGQIFERLESTVLYVTHDQEEAFTIADRVAVMRDGSLVQDATPEDLWQAPADIFVSDFLGFTNRFSAVAGDGRVDLGWIAVPGDYPPGPCQVVLRPDALVIDPDGPVSAVVSGSVFRGDHYVARVDTDSGVSLMVTAPARLHSGEALRLRLDPAGVLVLPQPQ